MIIFLYGADDFRSRKKLFELKEKFRNEVDPGGTSIKHLDGESIDLAGFKSAVASASLFVKRRFIVIENIFLNKQKEQLLEIKNFLDKEATSQEEKNDDNIIVFIDNNEGEKQKKNQLWQFLLKQKYVQHFPILSIAATNQWVAERAKELGATLSLSQANRLTGIYGQDMWMIDSELSKLINYKRGKSQSETPVIEDMDFVIISQGKIEENIFILTDAISNKDKTRALQFLEREMDAGTAETYLLHMILRQIRILLEIKQALESGANPGGIAKELKLHPYVVQKSLRQARSFSLEGLTNLFKRLVDLDQEIKTGKANFRLAIEYIIVKM
jgi:DNA polymerase-3 subunit delta